jgi:hypothetical protein
MARTGKIARLPLSIRSQLNSRLHNGAVAREVVPWLNSLPEVKRVLAQQFDGHPISEQNLSKWRQGGYEEWLAHRDLLPQAEELAANLQDLAAVIPGQSLTDHLAAAIGFRIAAILAAQGTVLDEKSLLQLRALRPVCQAVVRLRRSDQHAAELKFESLRWDMACLQLAANSKPKSSRPAPKPAKHHPTKTLPAPPPALSVHPVHAVHSVHAVHPIRPDPPSAPAPSPSNQIKPNQTIFFRPGL